jgi:centromere protein X
MPPEPRADGPSKTKSKPKPFKPPRPSTNSAVTQGGSSSRAQPSPSISRPRPTTPEADLELASELDSEGRQASIPPALLTRLLHEFFGDDQVRISKSADRAVGKYMDIFVREAIARAAVEKKEERGNVGRVGRGEGFLEVSLG